MSNGTPLEWGKLIKENGFSTVVALILLGALLGWIPSPLQRLEAKLSTHSATDGTRTYLLRQICQNLAIDKEVGRKCLQDSSDGR